MKVPVFNSFDLAIKMAHKELHHRSELVHSLRWQGIDIASRPEMATHEVTHVSFGVQFPREQDFPMSSGGTVLDALRMDIKPNLPWADNHFMERVSGAPTNPGVEWKNWPYGSSAATFLDERGKFNHNYMERYWPKHAGRVHRPTANAQDWMDTYTQVYGNLETQSTRRGIMYDYGDLGDVVELLARDPYTRQAYLPIWFPEDTGGGNKRAPCTIGYHFIMRGDSLDINYHIRSCDFVRHFRDDLYLTARLIPWVIEQCQNLDERWLQVRPGKFMMQIGSLHVFRNDYNMLFGSRP